MQRKRSIKKDAEKAKMEKNDIPLKKKAMEVKMKKSKKEMKKPEKQEMIEITVKKKALGEAPEEFHFYLSDGRKVKSLFELIEALENMSDEVFRHHVNEFKNDFSTWVKDVFEDHDLAQEIENVESRIDTEVRLLKHLVKELTVKS